MKTEITSHSIAAPMAIYTNVVHEFRKKIEDNLTLNDVIDILIAQRLIDEKLYIEIWANQNNRVHHLLDVILKDAKRCAKFIDIMGSISHMKHLSESIRKDIDRIRTVIVLGGFPEFSLNYVVRNSVANAIRDMALDLNIGIASTLVIHGLPGFGKSCLVNQVLQTKCFLEVSGGAMFWINLGEHLDTTNVINPLWNLYLNAVKLTNQVALSHRPEDLSVLQDELKRVFLEPQLKNAFIILDDVKSSEVLRVFKIHNKLIVTTQDKNVANDSEALFIKVTTGFTKKESLELLRKSLDADSLSSKENFAHKIHDLCDGCPMLLNIIGSILKDSREEALSTDKMWLSIIDEIKSDNLHHPTTEKVIHMIQMFVTCLSPEVQTCFHSLAVFPKHVNIRPEILMKLWNKSYYSVRQIMVELENKSLVVSFFNQDLKIYIYSIHSLVRSYLVEKNTIDVEHYHKKMISEYDDIMYKLPLDDPCANYIFGYYGYHAKNAKLYDKFEKYFDLKFIENKIKRVGSADLLTDFDEYKDLITKRQPSLEKKLQDFKKFVNSYSAHLHISPETNIIQFAFFSNNNCVCEEARNIANNNPDQLYFKVDHYSGNQKHFPVLEAKSVITSACFLKSKEVLVGMASGSIEIKSFHQYQFKVLQFEGHTDKVFDLQLSPDAKSFLSISDDHTVKLWRFAEDMDPQSPKYKQENWKNLHSPDESNEPKTFKMQDADYIISAAFPNDNSDEIVTASNKGRIVRWNTKTAAIIKHSPEWGFKIPRILYSHDSQQIIFSYDGKVFLYLRENLVYNGQFAFLDYFNDLILAPISSNLKMIVAVSGKQLELWEYVRKLKMFRFETDSEISCSVVSNNYLVLGTTDYIYTYDFETSIMHQYKSDCGKPTSLYVLRDRIAFICLDKDKVQRCEVYFKPSEKPIVHDLSLFSCCWKESSPIYFIVNAENKIDIFNGHSMILSGIDDIKEKIRCAAFSLCGNYLIFGTDNGLLYFYNYKKKKTTHLKLCNGEISLIKCFESDLECVDTFDSNNVYGVVVAASTDRIMVIVNKEIKMVLSLTNRLSSVFCLHNHLIAINVKGKICVGNLLSDQLNSWTQEEYKEVIAADIHKGKRLLAIACKETNYVLKIVKFTLHNTLSIKTDSKIELDAKPTCLCFSFSGKLLAVGCDDGNIEVLNLENKFQEVMSLHKKSVEKLLFAPNFEPILVSLGDQIAWWNLYGFQESKDD
ncbi:apoptotic protease-activating factor 1, partial [Asbolus verrucosus]